MFVPGLAIFTLASLAAALAPDTGALIAARAIQGIGAADRHAADADAARRDLRAERRGLALGVWSGISGTAVALGPLVGGGVIALLDWHWIFGINVPIGALLVPGRRAAARREPRPQRARSTCPGWR